MHNSPIILPETILVQYTYTIQRPCHGPRHSISFSRRTCIRRVMRCTARDPTESSASRTLGIICDDARVMGECSAGYNPNPQNAIDAKRD